MSRGVAFLQDAAFYGLSARHGGGMAASMAARRAAPLGSSSLACLALRWIGGACCRCDHLSLVRAGFHGQGAWDAGAGFRAKNAGHQRAIPMGSQSDVSGVLLVILGQAIFYGSRIVFVYLIGVALLFEMFVVLYEEPVLRARFGEPYEAYRRQVHRWIPRPPRSSPGNRHRGDGVFLASE